MSKKDENIVSDNNEQNIIDIDELIPSVDSFFRSQEEYILMLEMAVQLLQREVEHLRNHIKQRDRRSENGKKSINRFNKSAAIFNTCSNPKKVLSKMNDYLSSYFSLIESNIFLLSPDRKLIAVNDNIRMTYLEEIVLKLENEGKFFEFADSNSACIYKEPNTDANQSGIKVVIAPLILRGNAIGFFISAITDSKNAMFQEELDQLTFISGYAAIALDNIRSSQEISQMNQRLKLLNNQMMQSTKLASIGEIASAIAGEVETPLQVVKGHINLLENGVGDKKRRIQIIKDQINKIADITERLSNLAHYQILENAPAAINICSIIDEVLLFSSAQLQRDGIGVEKDYDSSEFQILAIKPQLEQVFLNIMLIARDAMLDGGTIYISVFSSSKSKVVVSIADTGKGIDEKELATIFDPFYKGKNIGRNGGLGLYLSKNIIEQHGGTISVFSETGKGSTFKITLPLINQD